MFPRKLTAQHILTLFLLMLFCAALRSDEPASKNSARMAQLPQRVLWVWERPEDLHAIDPATTAVAYLDQTIFIADSVESRPRAVPLIYPNGTALIPVVRIEAPLHAVMGRETEQQTVALVLRSAQQPGIVALQIDFDATRSQRAFYRNLLRRLRAQMPLDLPLSMTALASWCSYDDWIGALPVDEAVPMFFRMEPDRRRAPADLPVLQINESLCMRSVGVSTHEPWPQWTGAKRVYIFPDRGWRDDLALLEPRKLP